MRFWAAIILVLTSPSAIQAAPPEMKTIKDFKKLIDSKELTIMIHGLINDNAGAIAKVVLAKNKLKKLFKKPRFSCGLKSRK